MEELLESIFSYPDTLVGKLVTGAAIIGCLVAGEVLSECCTEDDDED